MELHLWRLRLEILQSCYPVGTLKPDIQMWMFQICFGFFSFSCKLSFLINKKIKTCWIYNNVFANWGKYKAETFIWSLLLIFKVVYRDHLTQLLPFAWDFIAKRQWLVWGQVG